MTKHTSHLFIPDTQVTPDTDTDHLVALGNYAADKKPDKIIMIGDWWDMASLCSYEKPGSRYFHDKSYHQDIEAGNAAMVQLLNPILSEVARLERNHKKRWNPELHFCLGNHEDRINRCVHENPVYAGTIGVKDLHLSDWIVHPFLEIVTLDGVMYSHYFVNPDSLTANPVGGTIENKLKLLGGSFSMGHQQRRQYGCRFTADGREQHGLVCGAFYQEDLDYLGPQKNKQYWRGIVMKHEVVNGAYDPMFVSLNFLLDNYL